jgi:hypothetical protein
MKKPSTSLGLPLVKFTLRTTTLKNLTLVQGGMRPVTRFPACDSHNQICQ